MKYFLNATERKSQGGTCYFEFQKGKFKNKFWLKNSVYIHDDVLDSLELGLLFSNSIDNFDYFGLTKVNAKEWDTIVKNSAENEQWNIIIEELRPWVEECFTEYEFFTICGI